MGERIIETWIQAKHPNQELCEDGLYTGRHYFAVIDGVTSKGSLVWPGEKTGGRFAKDVLLGALETLPEDRSAQEAVSCLNHALRSASFQALEHPELLEQMIRSRKLPLSQLALGSGAEKKTLERHRKYLIAILLAFTNGFEIIRGHLSQMKKGGAAE